MGRHPFPQSAEALLKDLPCSKAVVLHLSGYVATWIGASRTQLCAQVEISDMIFRQFILQRFAVELGRVTAVGTGPDIAEDVDAMRFQQFHKTFNRVNRMADCEKFQHLKTLILTKVITAAASLQQ
jgi:hypothetical protein